MSNLRELENVANSTLLKIQEILGIPHILDRTIKGKTIKVWIVLKDSLPNQGLYIIHHTEDFLKVADSIGDNKYLLRGVIVDVNLGMIVADSFGHNPVVVSDTIPTGQIQGESGQVLNLGSTENKYYRGVPGVVIRVFFHKGTIYFSSYKSIQVIGTRAGYNNFLYGDALEQYRHLFFEKDGFFGKEEPGREYEYSPFVHHFMLMLKPYFGPSLTSPAFSSIAYLKTSDMRLIQKKYITGRNVIAEFENFSKDLVLDYDNFMEDIFEELSDIPPPEQVKLFQSELEAELQNKFFGLNQDISLEEAEEYLHSGFHGSIEGDHMPPSEFVMIYMYKNGKFVGTVRVDSLQYTIRNTLRGDTFNMTLRFFELLDYTRTMKKRYFFQPDGYKIVNWQKKHLSHALLLPSLVFPDYKASVEFVKTESLNGRLMRWPLLVAPINDIRYDVYRAWVNLIFSLNLYERQKEDGVINLYEYYEVFVNQLYWLSFFPDLWEQYKDQEGYRGSLYHFFIAVAEHKIADKVVVIRDIIVPATSGKVLYHFSNILLEELDTFVIDFVTENFESPHFDEYRSKREALNDLLNDSVKLNQLTIQVLNDQTREDQMRLDEDEDKDEDEDEDEAPKTKGIGSWADAPIV